RAAHDFPPPRVPSLWRTALLTVLFGLVVTTLGTFLVILLVPATERALWVAAPLAGLPHPLVGPAWTADFLALGVAAAAVLVLLPAVHAALADAEQIVHQSSAEGTLPVGLSAPRARFGRRAQALDVPAAAMVVVMLASGGRVTWLARAYAVAISLMLALGIAALVRLRQSRTEARPFKAPLNLRIRGRTLPLGLLAPGIICGASVLTMMVVRDVGALVSLA